MTPIGQRSYDGLFELPECFVCLLHRDYLQQSFLAHSAFKGKKNLQGNFLLNLCLEGQLQFNVVSRDISTVPGLEPEMHCRDVSISYQVLKLFDHDTSVRILLWSRLFR